MVEHYIQIGQAPNPEGKAPRRWEFEGFDGVEANSGGKVVTLLTSADFVADKVYVLKAEIYAMDTNGLKIVVKHHGRYWGGTIWGEQLNATLYDAVSTSWGDGGAVIDFSDAGNGDPARIRIALMDDKDYNSYYWYRVRVVEIDTSAPLLP